MFARRTKILALALACLVAALAATTWLFPGVLSRVPLVGSLAGPRDGHAADQYVCPMHPEVRSATPATCPDCGMDLVKESELAHASHDHGDHGAAAASEVPRGPVSLDGRRQQLIGVRLASAEMATIDRVVRAVGTVAFDETRQSDVNLRVEGYVRELFVDATGQLVTRGQPLLTLYSPELAATEREYLLALAARDRVAAGGGETAAYADRLVTAARSRLAQWGLPEAVIDELERTRAPRETVTFTAPASGVVVEKRVVRGQRVMAGETLYRLADLSTVWVEAEVFERDLAGIAPGARATVTVAAVGGETIAARVLLIAPALDPATRAARVRFALPNPGTRLRPGMFADVELAAARRRALTVPVDALVDSGTRRFVFVSQGEGYFEPREVEIGARTDRLVEITRGLAEGEQVASGATFFIDSESQLRAAMGDFASAPPPPAAGATAADPGLRIDFRTDPDPPRNGDSGFEVTVIGADGAPVTDAEVQVRLYMAPMPSMNMPAMRTDVPLLHAGEGTYRGRGNISMAGRWDVTVTVSRGGQRLGSRMLGLVAK